MALKVGLLKSKNHVLKCGFDSPYEGIVSQPSQEAGYGYRGSI